MGSTGFEDFKEGYDEFDGFEEPASADGTEHGSMQEVDESMVAEEDAFGSNGLTDEDSGFEAEDEDSGFEAEDEGSGFEEEDEGSGFEAECTDGFGDEEDDGSFATGLGGEAAGNEQEEPNGTEDDATLEFEGVEQEADVRSRKQNAEKLVSSLEQTKLWMHKMSKELMDISDSLDTVRASAEKVADGISEIETAENYTGRRGHKDCPKCVCDNDCDVCSCIETCDTAECTCPLCGCSGDCAECTDGEEEALENKPEQDAFDEMDGFADFGGMFDMPEWLHGLENIMSPSGLARLSLGLFECLKIVMDDIK